MSYKLSLSNNAKMYTCLACMFGYGFVYREFLKQPLLNQIAALPMVAHDLVVLAVFSPVWIMGACSVAYYLKSQKNRKP